MSALLHIIHYSSFVIHYSFKRIARPDSFRHSLRSCHLPQEGGYLGFASLVPPLQEVRLFISPQNVEKWINVWYNVCNMKKWAWRDALETH
jgi:hypothetical protein